MRERGLTLVEALVALGILAVILSAVAPTFMTYLDANTLSEIRTGAMLAAEETMEQLRRQDPASLPTTGTSPLAVVHADARDFEVLTRYCVASQYCNDDSRHLMVEVSYGGRTVYTVESIFTTLR